MRRPLNVRSERQKCLALSVRLIDRIAWYFSDVV